MCEVSSGAGNEKKQKKFLHESSTVRGIKKQVYELPSGRRLKILLDWESEASAAAVINNTRVCSPDLP